MEESHQEDGNEDEHFDKPESAEIPDNDSPQGEKNDFHVEDDEEKGHLVKTDGKTGVRLFHGKHAALVRRILSRREGPAPDPMGNQEDGRSRPRDEKEEDSKGQGG